MATDMTEDRRRKALRRLQLMESELGTLHAEFATVDQRIKDLTAQIRLAEKEFEKLASWEG